MRPNEIRTWSRLVWWNASIPALFLVWDAWQRQLGANPIEAGLRTTGVLALIFLVLTLAVTPLVRYTKQFLITPQRRTLGLTAFFYALAHFLIYLIYDRGLDWARLPADIWKRPFILVGFASLVLMIPLAATSTNAMIKRLGAKRWKQLHRLTYAIAAGGLLHYALIVKSDLRIPIYFALVTAGLLALRFKRAKLTPSIPRRS